MTIPLAGAVLFRGAAHVVEYVDDDIRAISPRSMLGVPFAEVFPEPDFEEPLAAMDAVYHGAGIVKLDRPYGTLILGPRVDGRGRVFGVASWFQLDPAKVAARPRPTLLVLPEPVGPRAERGAG